MDTFLAFKRNVTIGIIPTPYFGIMTFVTNSVLNIKKVMHYLDLSININTPLSEYISDYITRIWFCTFTFIELKLLNCPSSCCDNDYFIAVKYGKKIYQILYDVIMDKWHHSIIQSNQLWCRNRVSSPKHHCNDSHVSNVLFAFILRQNPF